VYGIFAGVPLGAGPSNESGLVNNGFEWILFLESSEIEPPVLWRHAISCRPVTDSI